MSGYILCFKINGNFIAELQQTKIGKQLYKKTATHYLFTSLCVYKRGTIVLVEKTGSRVRVRKKLLRSVKSEIYFKFSSYYVISHI